MDDWDDDADEPEANNMAESDEGNTGEDRTYVCGQHTERGCACARHEYERRVAFVRPLLVQQRLAEIAMIALRVRRDQIPEIVRPLRKMLAQGRGGT